MTSLSKKKAWTDFPGINSYSYPFILRFLAHKKDVLSSQLLALPGWNKNAVQIVFYPQSLVRNNELWVVVRSTLEESSRE